MIEKSMVKQKMFLLTMKNFSLCNSSKIILLFSDSKVVSVGMFENKSPSHPKAFAEEGSMMVYLCPSVCLSVTNILRDILLTNHCSHPLETWNDTSKRGPTHHLPLTGRLITVSRHGVFGIYTMSKN